MTPRARPLATGLRVVLSLVLGGAAGWATTVFRLDLAVVVFAAAWGLPSSAVPAAVAAVAGALLHHTGWSTAASLATGLAAAAGTIAVLRRRGTSEALPIHLAARLLAACLFGAAALFVQHALQQSGTLPDLHDGLTGGAGIVGGLVLGSAGWWIRDRRRAGTPLVLIALTAAVSCFAIIATTSFWARNDERLLDATAASVSVSFNNSLIDEMNILATKASTSAEQDFDADTFDSLMQTIVLGHQVIGGAALVDRVEPGAPIVPVAGLSPLGDDFQRRLREWVPNATDAIDEVASSNAIGYIGSAELPDPDGGVSWYLLYATPVRNPELPNTPLPTRFMVVAMSVDQLLAQAVAPTPVARDEVRMFVSSVTGDTAEHLWHSSANLSGDGEQDEPPVDIPGEQSIAASSIGPSTLFFVTQPGVDLGTPAATRALVVAAELTGGALLIGLLLFGGDRAARQERERRRREALLSAALQGSAGWTAIVDEDDLVVMSNGDRHGAPNGAPLAGAGLWNGERDAVDAVLALLRTARGGEEGRMQHIWSDPDDPSHAMRIFEVEARPLRYRDLVYLQCVDVTEHRDRAMRTAQSERMEAIGVLAGGLAHDFNNLLFITLGYLQMLERLPSINNDAQTSMFVTRAIEAVERGATVAKSLLAFARSQPLTSVPVNLQQFVTELRPLIEQALGSAHRLVVHADGEHLDVVIDPGRLSSSILNTVFNARDAMEGPGTVEIRIERCVAAPVDGTASNVIAISIRDTGRGMPPEVVARAFEPFFTTKQLGSGTGLGLSTLYSFAQQSGGWAAIDSAEGTGTTVTLFLPPAVEQPGPSLALRAPRTATRALVVDDEQALGELVASWLDDLGMTTRVATGPDQALALAEQFQPELLVSDANLGTSIDGLELARMLVQRDPALLVVFMTGFSDRIRALQAAGVATLAKPFSRDDLVAALSVHLGDRFVPQHPKGGRP